MLQLLSRKAYISGKGLPSRKPAVRGTFTALHIPAVKGSRRVLPLSAGMERLRRNLFIVFGLF
jgi:hypothetical protein